MGMKEILDKDTLMGDIEEIRDVVINNFEELEGILILWETQGGPIHHRAYGTSTNLIGLLAKAQYVLLKESVGETTDKPIEEE